MSDRELRQRLGGRSDIEDLQPYRAPQLDAPVRLNVNESPYPPPESFMRDLADRVAALPLHRYPPRDFPEVRDRLAVHLGTLSDRVWVANGSNEIILQLVLAFGGAERKALTLEPTYGMHSHITRVSGTRPLRGRRNPDYTLHLDATIQAISTQQPDIVFLCSPNNPTGNTDPEEVVDAICHAAPGLVVLDEAYGEFSGTSMMRLVEDHEQLVIVRSFSKAWRLAGARIGYLIAQPWVIEQVHKVRLPYHLSMLTQAAALTAFDHAAEITSTIETLRHERERLWHELSTMRGLTAFPSQANFVLFRCEAKTADEAWQELLDRGVLVRNFSEVVGCENCLRVSVGTPDQNERFLETLYQVLSR